jgi:ribosomal protein S18 acetylase RimI-like enzyme
MGTLVLVDVLWVDESCRGQGLGARLLAAAETDGAAGGPEGWS